MSYEKDKGDEYFVNFEIKKALHWYLKARDKFFHTGKEAELHIVESKIAQTFALLGRKQESLDILNALRENAHKNLRIEEYYQLTLDIVSTLITYGDYSSCNEYLETVDEAILSDSNPQLFFRYWQIKAHLKIIEHELDEAREIVEKLMKKAKEIGNEPYFYELQVLQAQIEAENGNVLQAYSYVDEAFKYFKSTPYERAAFEKKIILSQFVEDPQETLKLIDEYMQRYPTEGIQPIGLESQIVEFKLRTGMLTPQDAIEYTERILLATQSLEMRELEARIRRLLAGLYHTIGDPAKAVENYEKARKYYQTEKLEYEEALTIFMFLPAMLQYTSAGVLGVFGFFLMEQNFRMKDYELEEEMEYVKNIFEKKGDQVRAKMTHFFELSFKMSLDISMGSEFRKSLNEIKDIHDWMVEQGELQYSEMIGQFLDLLKRSNVGS
ncbi:MAG: hypothetical protein ACTSYD_07755 [Candidatus Heimdallarchaeaceae archaeon]